MGRHLSLQYSHVILVSGYPVFIAGNKIDHNMDVQYQIAGSHTS